MVVEHKWLTLGVPESRIIFGASDSSLDVLYCSVVLDIYLLSMLHEFFPCWLVVRSGPPRLWILV